MLSTHTIFLAAGMAITAEAWDKMIKDAQQAVIDLNKRYSELLDQHKVRKQFNLLTSGMRL